MSGSDGDGGPTLTMDEQVTPKEFLDEWLPELLPKTLDALQYLAPFDLCILGNTITLVDMVGSDEHSLGFGGGPLTHYPATFHWNLIIVATELSQMGLPSDSRTLSATFTIGVDKTTITYTLDDREKRLRIQIDPLPIQDELIEPAEQIAALIEQGIVTPKIVEEMQESLSSWPNHPIEESLCNQAYQAIHAHIENIPRKTRRRAWQGWRLTATAELWLRKNFALEGALDYAIDALERTKGFCESPTIQAECEELKRRREEVRAMYPRSLSIGTMIG